MPPKTLLSLVVITAVATACGPLVPLSDHQDPRSNTLTQVAETDDATVTLQYIGKQYRNYIFDLEVVNQTQHDLQVAPQRISYYASPKPFRPPSETIDVYNYSASHSALTLKRQFAYSPHAVQQLYDDRARSRAGGAIFLAVLSIGLATYDAVKDGEDSRKESWTKTDETKAVSRDLLVSAAITASEIAKASSAQAQEDSYYIPYELFPEVTIHSHERVRGKIFIPMEYTYRFARVIIPIGGTDYVFDFRRKK
ncbi:MAG TPA: hypothetical protein VGK59_00755 [Ohtaekwangia sp.]